MTAALPNDVIQALRQQLAERDAILVDQKGEIDRLGRQVAMLNDVVKGMLATRRRGVVVPAGQGLLFPNVETPPPAIAEAAAAADAEADDGSSDAGRTTTAAAGKKGTPRTPRKLDLVGLPSEDRVHDVAEAERVDPVTGKPLRKIGETVFEELDYQRAQLRVIRHVRPIYGPSADDGKLRDVPPVMADLPPRPLEGCAASAGLLSWLLVQKFANHLPLHRQEAIFGRDGMRIPKQTLCDWTLASGEALRPIVDRLQQIVCSGPVLQLDDTPVMCQAGRGEPNCRAYLWTFVNPQVDAVVHRFTAGRASRLLADELAGFAGTIVGDGYSGNAAAADKIGPGIPIGACWAHVTRKLRDAEDEAPSTAKLFTEDIRQLYAVEREATDSRLDPDGRMRLRREKSRPILGTIIARIRRVRGQFPDAGKMAKAMQYVRNQWRELRQFLRQFLRHGLVPIDNNEVERAIRPIAIGRKNWLFAGSLRGGRAAATIYSLVESCKRTGIEVLDYLSDVLVRVATHPASKIDQPLPMNWARHFAPAAPGLA